MLLPEDIRSQIDLGTGINEIIIKVERDPSNSFRELGAEEISAKTDEIYSSLQKPGLIAEYSQFVTLNTQQT